MNINNSGKIIILFFLLALSSFFSASETALMSLSKLRVRYLVDQNIKNADIVSKLIDNPNKLLSAILIGNNIVNIGASSLATVIAIDYFSSAGVGIATGIMTILVLIFGEITPKSFAANDPEKISLKVCKIISLTIIILNPIIIIFNKLTELILKLLGSKNNSKKPFITEDELKTLVNVGHEEGILEIEEKAMIHNVFEFTDLQVKDIMTQRTNIIAIQLCTPYEDIMELFKEEHFSRIPVYENNVDEIVGILHLKDLIFHNIDNDNFDIKEHLRTPYFTYEYKPISELFSDMRKKRVSLSIVLDEYGGTAGLISIEDLVEEIVGDLDDEYDEHTKNVEIINENEFLVDGFTKLSEVNEILGSSIESEDFDTIGGYIIGEFGWIPQEGDMIEVKDLTFIIDKIDRTRISLIKIIKHPKI
ncbi:HlyC/CorC family transporter [Clostridium senegalense]